VKDLEKQLKEMGKDVEFIVYPGTGHAFGNEENALGTYDAEATQTSWERAVTFLRTHLAG